MEAFFFYAILTKIIQTINEYLFLLSQNSTVISFLVISWDLSPED